jgi:hypothetical protein
MTEENSQNRNALGDWLKTLPGIITSIATLITAIAGLIVILNSNGCFKPTPIIVVDKATTDSSKKLNQPSDSKIPPTDSAPSPSKNPCKIIKDTIFSAAQTDNVYDQFSGLTVDNLEVVNGATAYTLKLKWKGGTRPTFFSTEHPTGDWHYYRNTDKQYFRARYYRWKDGNPNYWYIQIQQLKGPFNIENPPCEPH